MFVYVALVFLGVSQSLRVVHIVRLVSPRSRETTLIFAHSVRKLCPSVFYRRTFFGHRYVRA